ncbi:hypothetical protein D0864_04520 [Hortaea werneckii]|uniref:Uncharacterized protein n=1 Tax=Hortaea werneckii TaxID=91943 RepID=A0A3M7GA69_HORWE|nr:hypothetical protein D0864_04520 [Hortaea werneckii]
MQAPVRGLIAVHLRPPGRPRRRQAQPVLHLTSTRLTSKDSSSMRHVVTVVTPDSNYPAVCIKTQLVITIVYTITLLLITRYSIDPAITYFRSSV